MIGSKLNFAGRNMTEIEQFLAESSATIDLAFERLLPQLDREPTSLYEAIRWSLFGRGKRFRPALVFASAKAFGVELQKVQTTAAAIEMIHTYSLIHDDLPSMDDDDLRRGRQTCHVRFDESTAILAGDALQAMAFASIANDENLSAVIRIKLLKIVGDAAALMVEGQQMDLEAEGKEISIETIEDIHRKKTGALINASACVGAVIADPKESDLAAISNFGENIGLLFQMTDDLLDISESSATLGKTAGKDLASAKATYPSVIGIEATVAGAEQVYIAALKALDPLSGETQILKQIAEYIINRRS